MEHFTLSLTNVTGGARLGSALNASLQVNKNDDPIYFAGKHFTHFLYAILRIPKMIDLRFASGSCITMQGVILPIKTG